MLCHSIASTAFRRLGCSASQRGATSPCRMRRVESFGELHVSPGHKAACTSCKVRPAGVTHFHPLRAFTTPTQHAAVRPSVFQGCGESDHWNQLCSGLRGSTLADENAPSKGSPTAQPPCHDLRRYKIPLLVQGRRTLAEAVCEYCTACPCSVKCPAQHFEMVARCFSLTSQHSTSDTSCS